MMEDNTSQLKTNKDKRGEPLLPPCRVCGSKASGYHFGVISCEACKVFFRRYLRNNTPYICAEEDNCEVKPGKRGCSYCRLQKCLSLGMSKEGVQRGRHTVEKKHRTIKEVKMLREKEKATEKGEHLKDLARTIVQIYNENPFIEKDMLNRLPAFQKYYVELNSSRESIFGVTMPLPPKQYDDFYKATGLDVDDRWAAMERCLRCCEYEIICDMKYFKSLPGFDKLCLEDMCSLLKGACVDLSVICSLVSIDPDRLMFTCLTCGCTFGEYEFKMIYKDNDPNPFYNAVRRLKALNLTSEEMAVILPHLFLLARDTDPLKQPELVDNLRSQFSEVFYFVMSQSREQREAFVNELLDALYEFRRVCERQAKVIHDFLNAYPSLNLPKVVHELYGKGSVALQDYFAEKLNIS